MGTVHSASAVTKRMQQVTGAAQKAQKIGVQRAAMVMKTVHIAGLNADAPGGRLRNVGKKGTKLGVKYTMHGGANNPSAIVEATGAWPILNNPTKAHLIRSKKGRTLNLGNGLFRASAQHPGTHGKRTWQKAQPKALVEGTKELNKTMIIAVQKAFKG